MNLLVAHGAVLKHRRSQIVKRGGHHAHHFYRRVGKVRVAFQADEAHVGARQHSRIRRTMRLVTGLAALKAHRRMLERKWTPFVAMALDASRLIGGEALQHGWPDTAMRIVAVHTAHRAFWEFVMERPLELRPLVEVTAGA